MRGTLAKLERCERLHKATSALISVDWPHRVSERDALPSARIGTRQCDVMPYDVTVRDSDLARGSAISYGVGPAWSMSIMVSARWGTGAAVCTESV